MSVWDVTSGAAVVEHQVLDVLGPFALVDLFWPGVEVLSLCRPVSIKLSAYNLADRPFARVRQGSAKALQGQAVAEDHWSDRTLQLYDLPRVRLSRR